MSTLKVNNVTDLGDDAVITDGALVGAGKILQVVSTLKPNVFSTTSVSFTDVTDLTVSITPSATSSKVLVIANVGIGVNSQAVYVQLVRDSTALGQPTLGASQDGGFGFLNTFSIDNRLLTKHGISFLDSPNTTSATTYKIQIRTPAGNGAFVNRSDGSANQLVSSDITVMEVAG